MVNLLILKSNEINIVNIGGDELGFADYEILVRNKLGQVLGV